MKAHSWFRDHSQGNMRWVCLGCEKDFYTELEPYVINDQVVIAGFINHQPLSTGTPRDCDEAACLSVLEM